MADGATWVADGATSMYLLSIQSYYQSCDVTYVVAIAATCIQYINDHFKGVYGSGIDVY